MMMVMMKKPENEGVVVDFGLMRAMYEQGTFVAISQ
jgi:hypothetical protein